MKLFFALLLVSALAVFSVSCTKKDTQSELSITYGAFPCVWAGEAHISLIDSLVYQCVNVRGRAFVDYVITPVPNTGDKFSVALLNSTEYTRWSNRQSYGCINGLQCELKDNSLKKGSYLLNLNNDDLFIVISDQNRIERAFVTTSVRVYTP